MNRSSMPPARRIFAALLILCCFLLAGCGPQVIKGRPPFVNISAMSLIDGTLATEFDISNQNGVPMSIDNVDITVRVGESVLAGLNQPVDLVIDANSTEGTRSEQQADDFSQTLLASLQSGELKSLSFDLEGRVHTAEDGFLKFEQNGYLYPVPGKPGYFRSAVTQASQLKREDDL